MFLIPLADATHRNEEQKVPRRCKSIFVDAHFRVGQSRFNDSAKRRKVEVNGLGKVMEDTRSLQRTPLSPKFSWP